MADKICTVVIDGANVSCQKDGQADIAKLAAAIAYFYSLEPTSVTSSIKCVAFVPNFWLNVKPVGGSTPGSRQNGAMETEDWSLLQELVAKDHVILTPSQAHDDFYVIDYAVKHDGFIVTNDMFRDHVANKRVFHGKTLTTAWVRSHCIDFTFVGKEFLPNPRAMERVYGYKPAPLSSSSSAATELPSSVAPNISTLPSSSLVSQMNVPATEQDKEDDVDAEEDDMVVDHMHPSRQKKQIDLSDVTYYKLPRQLLPMLHGEAGDTMERFQEYTGTYIVLPSHAAPQAPSVRSLPDVLTLSIYGNEANRQNAVKMLDGFLHEMQQQAQYHQQQQMRQYHQQQDQYLAANYEYHDHASNRANPAATDDQMMDVDPF